VGRDGLGQQRGHHSILVWVPTVADAVRLFNAGSLITGIRDVN